MYPPWLPPPPRRSQPCLTHPFFAGSNPKTALYVGGLEVSSQPLIEYFMGGGHAQCRKLHCTLSLEIGVSVTCVKGAIAAMQTPRRAGRRAGRRLGPALPPRACACSTYLHLVKIT